MAKAKEKAHMTIGQFARKSGVSADTARFYEKLGLLNPVRMNGNNYRLYGPAEVTRIQFITSVREAGFSLAEARTFVEMMAAGMTSCSDYAAAAHGKLRQLDEQIHNLQKARRELKRALRTCVPATEDCVLAPPN